MVRTANLFVCLVVVMEGGTMGFWCDVLERNGALGEKLGEEGGSDLPRGGFGERDLQSFEWEWDCGRTSSLS